jgi:hypothetical protein
LIHYSKALAWFRGAREVGAAEVRALLPWVLHQRLEPNLQSPFFEREENKVFLTDRVSWIRQLYDRALEQHAAYRGTRAAVAEVEREGKDSLASLSTPEVQRRISRIERLLADVSSEQELNGPVQQDLLLLKSLHARYAGRLAVGPR